jgi:hypothetical protein
MKEVTRLVKWSNRSMVSSSVMPSPSYRKQHCDSPWISTSMPNLFSAQEAHCSQLLSCPLACRFLTSEHRNYVLPNLRLARVSTICYRHAMKEPFGSGRSRTFGYIEAQVLHAVVRHYKPARLIEIGGGVPTRCTYQAISMNRRDTGVNGHITCIEPHPIDMIKNIDESSDNVELIARPIHEVPLNYFKQLRANEIVSIDPNHVVRSGSEVNDIVLEILPSSQKEVLVHFHDIYLPYGYDRDVLRNFTHPNENCASLPREAPWLCRGGSRSLTFRAVVHR